MTLPRHVLPDTVVFITRRVHSRQFALRPDADVRQLFGYLLAVGARIFGFEVLAAVCMSDHYHLVAVDRRGCFPDFTQWFHMLMGRAVNVLRDRRDSLWSGEAPAVSTLADSEAILDRMCYTLANPVKAGAVSHGRDWPGFRTRPQQCLKAQNFERPSFFFATGGAMPRRASLELMVPPGFGHLSAGQFAGLFAKRVGECEAEARGGVLEAGRRFMGADACGRISWRYCAKSSESEGLGSRPDEVISRDDQSGDLARATLAAFRETYVMTRRLWLGGDRGVVWPAGTWEMVVRHRLPVHPPP